MPLVRAGFVDPHRSYRRSGLHKRLSARAEKKDPNRRSDQVTITKNVVMAAAENWKNGKEVMTLLLDRGDQIPITEKAVEYMVAVFDEKIMTLLLNRRGDQITINENVVVATVGNVWNGDKVMGLLLDQRGDQITITEKVVIAAAGNWNGKEVMTLLLDLGDQIPMTEKAVENIAAVFDEKVMGLLLDRRGDRIIITENEDLPR
jgi:hypothetical protein